MNPTPKPPPEQGGHSPLPWAVSDRPGSKGVIICPSLRGYREGERNVARCSHSDLAGCASIAEAEANAALIVSRVNGWDGLVEENRRLREALVEIAGQKTLLEMDEDARHDGDFETAYDECISVARSAISPSTSARK